MATILIVDDSAVDERVAAALLQKAEMEVMYADDGQHALAKIEERRRSLVLTDLNMSAMDGLTRVNSIGENYPSIPTILMTTHGSEETAAAALRAGAYSYVPKKYLSQDLVHTVQQVLGASTGREHSPVIDCLVQSQCTFVVPSDTG